jgi:hypothetical protein
MPSALPQLPSSKNRQPLDRERDLEKQGEGKRNSQRNGAGSPRRASGRSAKESARCARRAERAIKNARQRLHLAKPKAERARESLLWRCLRRLPRYGLDRRACGRAHGERSERLKCRSAIVWILPSPARARRACPLPGQGEGSRKAGRGKTQLANSWVCEFLFSAKIIGLRDSARMTKVASPRAGSG